MNLPTLTVRNVTARAVNAPIKLPLTTSRGTVGTAPFVLVDLETEEGITGHGYAFCYMDLAAPFICKVVSRIAEMVQGDTIEPDVLYRKLLNGFTLIGNEGSLGMALSAFDIACWDALAKAANLPLSKLLGADRASVPAYNSKGLSLKDPDALADEALALLDEGFKAVKLRLGRDDAEADLKAARAVRDAIPADTVLMADYNQALDPDEMLARLPALEAFDLHWIEEPIRHDDFAGSARLVEASTIPIQIGENFNSPQVMAAAIAAKACHYAMPDLGRIGGVTAWREAAHLASDAKMPMSSHLYSEVSAHCLAATPTCHWLEVVDWAEGFLQEPLRIEQGRAIIPETPGAGIEWDEAAVERYRKD